MNRTLLGTLIVASLGSAAVIAREPDIRGDYLEVRTADVYTGPCFANAEVNLKGRDAILAWSVREGSWQGVALEGLSVVAAIRASATLGDPFRSPLPMRSVIVLDERADARQRGALVSLVRSLAGDLLAADAVVEIAPIRTEFGGASGVASVSAGELADVRTRALCAHDNHCGNEEVYYPPLTNVRDAVPAFALANAFRGRGLGGTWTLPGKRSAFVGTFAR